MNNQNCEHWCSGNCRRTGCNCECGEWHRHSVSEIDGCTKEVAFSFKSRIRTFNDQVKTYKMVISTLYEN